jgi:hypothetical protein
MFDLAPEDLVAGSVLDSRGPASRWRSSTTRWPNSAPPATTHTFAMWHIDSSVARTRCSSSRLPSIEAVVTAKGLLQSGMDGLGRSPAIEVGLALDRGESAPS